MTNMNRRRALRALAGSTVGLLALPVVAASAEEAPAPQHVTQTIDPGSGTFAVPSGATSIVVTLTSASGEVHWWNPLEPAGGRGGTLQVALGDEVAGTELVYAIGAVGEGSPERADDRASTRGGGGSALAWQGELLVVLGGGGGEGEVWIVDDVQQLPTHGGDGGIPTTPGVAAGGDGRPGDPGALHAAGWGGSDVGGLPDPEASYAGSDIYGGAAGESGPPTVSADGIALSLGGTACFDCGGGGAGYSGGGSGSSDDGDGEDLMFEYGAGGGGSGYLSASDVVGVVPGTAAPHAGDGSMTIEYELPPVPTDQSFTVPYDEVSQLQLEPSDGSAEFMLVGPPANGTVRIESTGLVTYQPVVGFSGADSLVAQATRGDVIVEITVSITVLPPAPVAVPVSMTVDYGAAATAVPLSVEHAASYAVATQPSHGQVAVVDGGLTYAPDAGYHGADAFTYTAANPAGTSAPATVSVTVADPALTVMPTSLEPAVQGQPYSASLTAGGGAEPYSYVVRGLPDGLMLASETSTIEGSAEESGDFEVVVEVTDASVPTASTSVTLPLHVFSNVIAVPAEAAQGDVIDVTGEGIQPGDHEIVLRSDPVTIGTATVADDGVLAAAVTIPADAEVGDHVIELVADDIVIGSAPIEVTAMAVTPTPDPTTDPSPSATTSAPADADDDASSALPQTGASSPWLLALLAVALLSVGAGLALGRRRPTIGR